MSDLAKLNEALAQGETIDAPVGLDQIRERSAALGAKQPPLPPRKRPQGPQGRRSRPSGPQPTPSFVSDKKRARRAARDARKLNRG